LATGRILPKPGATFGAEGHEDRRRTVLLLQPPSLVRRVADRLVEHEGHLLPGDLHQIGEG